MIGIILLIVWLVISTLLITSFSVEWGRTLIYGLADSFGYNVQKVDQVLDLDPIIRQIPYVCSLALLVVSTIVFNYRSVRTGIKRFGQDSQAAWDFILRTVREHVTNHTNFMIALGVVP